jgi:hypothetical protein
MKSGLPLRLSFAVRRSVSMAAPFPASTASTSCGGGLARDELVEHQAERVDITGGHDVAGVLPHARGDVPPVEMLQRRSGDAKVRGVRDEGQVEVPQLDDPARGDDDVAGADVPVDDAVLVSVRQSRGHAFDDPGFLIPRQGPLAVLVEQPLEKLPQPRLTSTARRYTPPASSTTRWPI